MSRLHVFGLSIALLGFNLNGPVLARQAPPESPSSSEAPRLEPANSTTNLPVFPMPAPQPPPDANPNSASGSALKPLMEGPLHEAFLSPAKDRKAPRVEKAPPSPVQERPAVDPPDASAKWIEGYWEWDTARRDFVWVTGTWRVPPPGRFWVNGYWKRDGDGWYRVPGFWSDRRTDRVDYRKNGPPEERPDDDPGDPPGEDTFYIPGQYYPDGDGVVWKQGFWAKAQPGWAWVPAQWVRQPEGWVFQNGFWDRTLEDRGTLFAPAAVDAPKQGTSSTNDLVYQPYTKVSPELYGQLNGAFGRPNSNYDGYPGVTYDESGRYYGYAGYGNLGNYYGYLDYPFYGGYGYPYYATPVIWGGYGGFGYPYAGYGYGLCGGMLGGMFGFGYGAYPVAFGFGLGFPWYGYGGFGYPNNGYGYGGFGNAAFSYGGGLAYGGFGLGGLGFGFGGFGLGGFGYGGFGWGMGLGFGYPWWGGWGFGYPWWGGWGYGGWGYGGWCRRYPFNPGRGGGQHHRMGMNGGHRGVNAGHLAGMANHSDAGGFAGHGGRGVQAPPASRAFGNPYHRNSTVHRTSGLNGGSAGRSHLNVSRTSTVANSGSGWHSSYNGVHGGTNQVHHTGRALGANAAASPSAGIGHPGQSHLANPLGNRSAIQGGQALNHAAGMTHNLGLQGGQAASLHSASPMGTFSNPVHQANPLGGAYHPGMGFSGGATHSGYNLGHPGGASLGSGFNGGFSGGHMGGFSSGGFSGGHMGGMGGMGGGHGGGGGHR